MCFIISSCICTVLKRFSPWKVNGWNPKSWRFGSDDLRLQKLPFCGDFLEGKSFFCPVKGWYWSYRYTIIRVYIYTYIIYNHYIFCFSTYMFLYLPSCIFYNKYISYIYSIHIKNVSPVGFFSFGHLKIWVWKKHHSWRNFEGPWPSWSRSATNQPPSVPCTLHEKKNSGWLGSIGDDKLPSYMGIIS